MSEVTKPADEAVVISGTWELTHQLTQQRTMRITGYVYATDLATGHLNARLDAAQDWMDRQFVRCDVVNKEAQIQAVMGGIEQHRETIDALIKKRDEGTKKLSSQERQTIDRWDDNLRNAKANIRSLESAVAEGRKKLNGVAHA